MEQKMQKMCNRCASMIPLSYQFVLCNQIHPKNVLFTIRHSTDIPHYLKIFNGEGGRFYENTHNFLCEYRCGMVNMVTNGQLLRYPMCDVLVLCVLLQTVLLSTNTKTATFCFLFIHNSMENFPSERCFLLLFLC